MSNIFTPSKDTEFLNPFGPTMGYYKMPPELVDNLNAGMSESLNDYSDNLVGKVKQELEFTEKTKQTALEGLKDFIAQYSNFSEVRNSFGVRRLNSEKYNYGISIVSGWFVRQYEQVLDFLVWVIYLYQMVLKKNGRKITKTTIPHMGIYSLFMVLRQDIVLLISLLNRRLVTFISSHQNYSIVYILSTQRGNVGHLV